MKTSIRSFALLAGASLTLGLAAPGCGDDGGTDDGAVVQRDLAGGLDFAVGPDMSVTPTGDMAVVPDLGFDPVRNCYPAPADVHVEIINACSSAQKINKTPKAQYLDGGCCPPLP